MRILIIISLICISFVFPIYSAEKYFPGKNPEGATLKVPDPKGYEGRTTEGLTDELKQIILEKKRAAGCPNACDLEITYIERTPRYPRYYVTYGPGGTNPHLEGDEAKKQRWPLEGEEVTFWGHIINKGLAPSVETTWVMTLDGEIIGEGKIPALQPLDEYIASAKWKWQSGRHEVRMMADMRALNGEVTKTNNNVMDYTDAYTIIWTVRDWAHVEQDSVKNIYGSYSSEGWHRSVMEWMNRAFEGCVFPLTPKGVPARVRIGYYQVSPAPWRDHDKHPLQIFHDGGWSHYPGGVFEFEKHTPEEVAKWKEDLRKDRERNAIYDANQPGIDRALAHELSHQLGLIDIYHFNVPAQLNKVTLEDGKLLRDVLPNKAGRNTWQRGLMCGGDTPQVWEELHAYALVLDYGKRRGFFGEFLLDMPKKSSLRVLDVNGEPIPGAILKIYQRQGEEVPDKPVHEGRADDKGIFSLGEKPFGEICVVGTNGSLLCRVMNPKTEEVDWAWTQIDEFNLAKWRGAVEHAVIYLKTELK